MGRNLRAPVHVGDFYRAKRCKPLRSGSLPARQPRCDDNGHQRRNLRNAGANGSGFIDEVSREDGFVVVRFTDSGSRRTEVRLAPDMAGGWSGETIWPEGRQTIVMTRDQSVEVRAFGVPAYIPPPPPPPPKAKPVAKKKAKKKAPAKAKPRRPTASPSRASAKKK